MGTAAAPVVVVQGGGSPNILIRLVYFVLIGWWLGAIVAGLGWVLCLTILLLPVGLWMLNGLPSVITLRSQGKGWSMKDGVLQQGTPQRSFLVRALWFVLVGWWLSALWIGTAYGLIVTLLGIPISFWMFGRVGAVLTLYRS